MAQVQQNISTALKKLLAFLETSPWKEKYYFQIKEMSSKLNAPCVLAVAGRVKAGKSSFINALLGEDLALVGTTETTATINYFRFGTPPDPHKPILCVRDSDGSSTWESKEFLDSLQGNTLDVLQRSKGIRHLEFYINNPKLKNICLVDTPGTNALVGEDGSAHENVSREFFQMANELRKKHSKETIAISQNADALIYVTGPVADAQTAEFLQDFQGIHSQLHSYNTLAVMAKIDMDDKLLAKKDYYAQHMSGVLDSRLNIPIPVYPVSAGIQRVLSTKTLEDWMNFKQELHKTFDTFDNLEFALSDASIFEQFASSAFYKNMPWRVFTVIAKQIYSSEISVAISNLEQIAGFQDLLNALDEHFFRRGEFLRCYAIVQDTLKFLYLLDQQEWYKYCEKVHVDSQNAAEFIDFIITHPEYGKNQTAEKLRRFIKDHLPADNSHKLREHIHSLITEFEKLRDGELYVYNNCFEYLQILTKNIKFFNATEIHELQTLWGASPVDLTSLSSGYCKKRVAFWNTIVFQGRSREKKQIALFAVKSYNALLKNIPSDKVLE